MATKVKHETIAGIANMGMEAALAKHAKGEGDEEFNEAIKRYYSKRRIDEAKSKTVGNANAAANTPKTDTAKVSGKPTMSHTAKPKSSTDIQSDKAKDARIAAAANRKNERSKSSAQLAEEQSQRAKAARLAGTLNAGGGSSATIVGALAKRTKKK